MKRFLIAAAGVALALGTAISGASAQEKLKVGFIYVGPVGDMGWTYQHEVGRRAIQEQFKDKIDTSFLENVNEGPDAERSIEQLVRNGAKLVYTTSFGFMQKKHGFAPLGDAQGPVKTAIFGNNNAKLYNIQPKRAMLELKKDRITAWKEEYEKEGATPTNMRYGYVAGPVDHSLFA